MPLKCSPDTHISLGYILIEKCKRTQTFGATATEFLASRTQTQIQLMLASQAARFHVFYLDTPYKWTPVTQNFSSFIDAVPYLQGGIRVLIEYAR
jgi:hypothetical protein